MNALILACDPDALGWLDAFALVPLILGVFALWAMILKS